MSAVGDRRRSATRALARRAARYGSAWTACRAVAWLGRPAAVARWATGSTTPASDARDDLATLQQVADGANAPRVAERAAAVVQGLWASAEHRAVLWGVCWDRPLLATDTLPLLLTPDPDSRYTPQIRLVSGLPDDDPAAEEIGSRILDLACRLPGRETGDRVGDVLRRTDHPVLLRLLATGFARALDLERGSPHRGDRGAIPLWSDDQAQPLLAIVLAHPHLPPPPRTRLGEFGRHERVVLQVLRDRVDLLDEELRGEVLVEAVLRYPGRPTVSAPLTAACRRILRALPPGPGREALCGEDSADAYVAC